MDNQIDIEHIRDLVEQEIGEVISEEDNLYLHEVIQSNPEAKMVWDEMWALFNRADVQRAYSTRHERMTIQDVKQRAARKKKVVNLRRLAVAASVIILLTTSVFSYRYFTKQTLPLAQAKKAIQIKLASGKSIDISDSTGSLTLGNISLKSQNKTLNYSATGKKEQLTVIVPIGMDYHVNLPDGSAIYLNAGTTLQFPSIFEDGARDITVNGEAYLQVAPGAGKPFTVHLPTATVQVLGTEFNINTYNSAHSKVSLVQGAVKVQNGKDSTILKPGLQASFSASSSSIAIETFDQENTLSWRKGLYTFNNAGLQEILEVVPRWYGIEVVVDPGAKTDIQFSGVMDKHEPLDKFLNRFHLLTEMNSYMKDGVLHLK